MPGRVGQPPNASCCWLYKIELEGAITWKTHAFDFMQVYIFSCHAGFKSYRDTSTIGPFAPFSCIVGPNGCGKSVLVCGCNPTWHCYDADLAIVQACLQGDAVAFVLGSTEGNKSLQAFICDSLSSNRAAKSARVRSDPFASQYAQQSATDT